MRQIGNNTWLKPGVDFDKGETIIEKARYLGDEEGSFGMYQVFQDTETGECYNLGGGHLNWLCTQIEQGDVVKLDYEGEEKLTKGKFKGKKTHRFAMWVVEEEDSGSSAPAPRRSKSKKADVVDEVEDDLEEEEEVAPKTTRKKAAKKKTRGRPKAKVEVAEVDEDDDLEDLD